MAQEQPVLPGLSKYFSSNRDDSDQFLPDTKPEDTRCEKTGFLFEDMIPVVERSENAFA